MKIIFSFLLAGALLSASVTPASNSPKADSSYEGGGPVITVDTKYHSRPNTDFIPGENQHPDKDGNYGKRGGDCDKHGGDPSSPTPEPASVFLFAAGAVASGAFRKFRKKS